jgi:hypothetical protein
MLKILSWLAIVLSLPLQAHDMRQVKAVMKIDPDGWSTTIDVEAWSVFPEDAEHSPNASKAGEFAGREWVETLDQNDLVVMKQVAQSFLRDCFQLSLQGRNLDFDIALPFLDGPKPSWTFSAKGQAMAKMKLTGKWQPGDKGELMLLWNDYFEEAMSMQVKPLWSHLRVQALTQFHCPPPPISDSWWPLALMKLKPLPWLLA